MKPEDGASFTRISPNPYIVGNPVRDRHMFFGREAEFDLVKRRFVESRATGGLLIFCGERRSGKTSILFQIDQGRLGPEFVPVLIDMQSMAVDSEQEFLLKVGALILDRMGLSHPGLDPLVGSKRPAAVFRELVQGALNKHPERKLILLFDEYELFENKIKEGTISEEVLHQLAYLAENQSVFLVFTGSLSLEERHQEYWKVFLGRSTFKRISFLERRDALSLIIDPLSGRVQYEDGVVESIYRLTAGQPFYTQAVCQSIVDQLNERQTDQVSPEVLAQVVEGIVAQPFPQMTFRWEELEKNEKLVLALLAESITDSRSAASVKDLLQMLGNKRYPLRLEAGVMAAALDGLFRKEILLVFETQAGRTYAFRVDIWRHWIRRMHTVWQVMRELGMEIRPEERRRRLIGRGVRMGLLILAAGTVAWFGKDWFKPRPTGTQVSTAAPSSGTFSLRTNVADAMIQVDGQTMGSGNLPSRAFIQGKHDVLISREGYASQTFSVTIPLGGNLDTTISLVSLVGKLRIETFPTGAEVFVDNEPHGKSPVEVGSLRTLQDHTVRAVLAGYDPQIRVVRVKADEVTPLTISLAQAVAALTVRSDPDGANLFVDKVASGKSPKILNLPLGKYHLRAESPGFTPKDTTIVLSGPGEMLLVLQQRPKGFLKIQGEGSVYATMYVRNTLVQTSHVRWPGAAYDPDTYKVRIVFDDPSRPDTTFDVPVQSGCTTTLNYVTGAVNVDCSGGAP